MSAPRRSLAGLAALTLLLAILGACAAGDPRYSVDAPAGFWAGLWHGIISLIALILSSFTEVRFYEADNSGWWYDAGFLLGILFISGGGGGKLGHRRAQARRREEERKRDEEWEAIGRKVQAKLDAKLREWAETDADADWETLGPKVEAKLARELRKWADE
ncbi:hypothetical protein [Pseudenhygromyxa sp. WMMC2535]|uniref:hypothetical protein n=1 Tax=Pseudenhygromyxa sp. WMMC2535 TaxID=2712867 RepID=UPI001C3E131F|nr:hypothetical protein [Pseudenhygromyxa sp. WMMC2535]